jgi:hypothetical protein
LVLRRFPLDDILIDLPCYHLRFISYLREQFFIIVHSCLAQLSQLQVLAFQLGGGDFLELYERLFPNLVLALKLLQEVVFTVPQRLIHFLNLLFPVLL